MSEEILMNITPMESRVAVVENGVLQEVHVERTQRRGIVGNIYKGKVVRVLPGMQAAFVDIGLDRAAFIHASEISAREGNAVEPINALVHEGQSLVVQVTKDPIGTKGARLTTQLSIPSRYLVYMPRTSHVGISLRIEDEAERERLKQVVAECVEAEGIQEAGGFILRTAAEGAGSDEILMDIRYLRRLWEQIASQIKTVEAPTVIYEDLSLAMRTLRDLVNPRIEKIRIDSRENFQKVTQFVGELMPELGDRLGRAADLRSLWRRGRDPEGAGAQGHAQVRRLPDHRSGRGDDHHRRQHRCIRRSSHAGRNHFQDQSRVGHCHCPPAQTAQSGRHHHHRLHRYGRRGASALEKQLERDHAKTNIIGITELGLVQMTRKRTRESLEQVLCEPCMCCQGRGKLKTPETVCYEIFREILREARAYQAEGYRVLANQKVIDRLLDEESGNVADLEAFIGRSIKFQVESMYSQEQYDVVLL